MSSLDYLNAAKSAAQNPGKPAQHYAPVKKVEEPPPPAVVAHEEEDEVDPEEVDYSPADPAVPVPRRSDNRKFAGRFSRIEFANPRKENDFWQLIVVTAGPGFCNFALTCTYLYDKLMTPENWNLVSSQVLPAIPPIVYLYVETAVENSQSGQPEKLLTLNAAGLKANYQIQMLVNHWLRVLSEAEEKRNVEKVQDPTASKDPLKAILNGGFSIETGTAKNSQQIYYIQDLSLVPVVLKTIEELITPRSKKSFAKIPHKGGHINLSLYGRGGHHISFRYVKANQNSSSCIFALDEFINQIRKAAKKFIPLVGSCRMQIIRQRKSVPPKDLDSFREKEEWIKKTLNHEDLNTVVKQLRNRLSIGVVPGSVFPEHFQKKKILDQKKQDQAEIENANIMDLILENLPEHWEEAKAAAKNLEDYVKLERENEKTERAQRKKDLKEARERAQKEAQDQFNIEIKDNEPLETIPSVKKPKVPSFTKDDDGFITKKNEGKELEKPKTEEKPKPKKDVAVKKEKVNPSQNIFDIANEDDDLPTREEYLDSVRSARLKGKPEKPEKAQAQKPKPPKPKDEDKDADKEKKVKKLKLSQKKPEVEKMKNTTTVVADVPFWQNELFKPLVYVFGLVSLLSFLYLVLN